MQAEIDVHGHRALVFAARRGDRCVDEARDRYGELVCDAQEQSEVVAVHISRHGNREPVARGGNLLPHLLELTADEVGGAQMLKTPIGKRVGLQIRPEPVLDSAWLYARVFERPRASGELVVLQQRKAGLTVQHAIGAKHRNSGVVDVR